MDALKDKDLDMLENIIENEMTETKENLKMYSSPQLRDSIKINDPAEFVYGYAFGRIWTMFIMQYSMKHFGKNPKPEELDEASSIMYKKAQELKDSIQ